jgi:hypothetical protein
MTDSQLERLLLAAAASARYPETPDFGGHVLARIAETRPAPTLLRPSFVLAALLLLLIVAAAAIATSTDEDAIARFFGIEGSRIEPLSEAGATAVAVQATPAGIDALARPVALDDYTKFGISITLPRATDELRQAYIVAYGDQNVAVLHYDRFDLWQAQLAQDAYFDKGLVSSDFELRDVVVGRQPGRWLAKGPHTVRFVDGRGTEVPGSARVVERNTLIWRTPAAFYRIETDLALAEALRIAETLP